MRASSRRLVQEPVAYLLDCVPASCFGRVKFAWPVREAHISFISRQSEEAKSFSSSTLSVRSVLLYLSLVTAYLACEVS